MSHEPEPQNFELRLDHFLKITGIAGTGGQAKLMIQSGDVCVNGVPELRRRCKLTSEDVIEVEGAKFAVKDFLEP